MFTFIKNNYHKVIRNRLLVFSFVSFFLFSAAIHVFAVPPTTPYLASDAVLDPTCVPGGTNCFVSVLGIGSTITSATPGSILFADSSGNLGQDNANLFFDDTNNRLGIGTNAPESTFDFRNSDQSEQFKGFSGSMAYTRWGSDPAFRTYRANGSKISPTAVLSGQQIGSFSMGGYDGTAYTGSFLVDAFAAENYTPGSHASRLKFGKTITGNSSNVSIYQYVDEAGKVGIGQWTYVTNPTLVAKFNVIGTGATSSTYGFQVHNSTGTSNSLVIRDDGRVGIGTATPSGTLNILDSDQTEELIYGDNGRLAIHTYGSDPALRLFRSNGTRSAQTEITTGQELGQFSLGGYDGSTHRSTFAISNSAAENFTAGGTMATITTFSKSTTTSTTDRRAFQYVDSSNRVGLGNWALLSLPTLNAQLQVQGQGATSSTYTALFHNSTGTSNSLVVRDDGNIGIGTATPGSVIDIQRTVGSADIEVKTMDSTSSAVIFLDNDAARGPRIRTYGTTATGTLANGAITRAGRGGVMTNGSELYIGGQSTNDNIYIGGGTSGLTMKLDNLNNRVGIGPNAGTPLYRLDVTQDSASTYAARIFHDGNDDNRWGLLIQAGADTAAAAKFIQFNDGDGTDAGSICATAGVAGVCAPSDIRLKQDISDTMLSLDTLNRINVKDFSYISDITHKIVHGFIAQELYEVYPDAVFKPANDSTDFWKVSYAQLTPLLVKSVQELDVKVAPLERIIGTDESLPDMMHAFFTSVVSNVSDGIVYMKEIVAEKMTIGSREKPTGIILHDTITGNPYCVKITNGALVTVPGTDCSQNASIGGTILPENIPHDTENDGNDAEDTNPVDTETLTETPEENIDQDAHEISEELPQPASENTLEASE